MLKICITNQTCISVQLNWLFQGNYHEYIDLYNEAAKLNGFSDASMMKVDPYESKTFIQEMEDTWQVWIEM